MVYFYTNIWCAFNPLLTGADETGKKELIALQSGLRESEISWTEVLLGLKERGLKSSPHLCVGDGALGFWNALYKVYGTKAKIQRCWFHKMGNVLNKLPKNLQHNAKSTLQQVWMAQKMQPKALINLSKSMGTNTQKRLTV